MNPIPSHESYMRRMAAVTAVGAHRPTDTKRNLGFVIHDGGGGGGGGIEMGNACKRATFS